PGTGPESALTRAMIPSRAGPASRGSLVDGPALLPRLAAGARGGRPRSAPTSRHHRCTAARPGKGTPMNSAAVGAGFVLSGRYRLVEPLASGGMGTVWRALDLLLDRPVAVKEVRLPPSLDDDARQLLRRRTIREAQVAARL